MEVAFYKTFLILEVSLLVLFCRIIIFKPAKGDIFYQTTTVNVFSI